AGSVIGLGIAGMALGMFLPLLAQGMELAAYKLHAGTKKIESTISLTVPMTAGDINKTIDAKFPPSQSQSDRGPVIANQGVTHTLLNDGTSEIEIKGTGSVAPGADPADTTIVLRHGGKEIVLKGAQISVTAAQNGQTSIKFQTPPGVLLGA